jgi:glutathione reductase (NADPH)
MERYDFIAIGGGNTGLAAAYRIAAAGRKVALVDKGPVGGLCSLAGCNPKKVLVRATEVLDEVRRAGEHGIEVEVNRVDWSRVIDRKKSFTDPVPAQTEESLSKKGIALIRGLARFVSPDAIEVDGRELEAQGFLIATGSTPRRLWFPGAEATRISDDILDLREVPRDLVILGAGVVAFEFGQVFARLGSRVSMLMPSDRALRGSDADLVAVLVEHSKRLGIDFVAHTRVHGVSARGSRLAVEAEVSGVMRIFEADFVLNAAGRVAALESLNLPAAGVAGHAKGVVVDDYLRSPSNRRVFAGGDAHGKRQLSPVASYEGRIVARNFLEGDVERVDYEAVPQAVFTVPPLAWVGRTEEQARKEEGRITVASHDMENWRVFAIAGERPARAKVVLEERTQRILGAHLLGACAAELIHVFAMAMRYGLTATDLDKMVWVYPSFSAALDSTWK